jgi:hypothetical protein
VEKNPYPGSTINITDNIPRAYKQFLGLKTLKLFVTNPDPRSGALLTLNPGSGMKNLDPG